MATHQTPHNPYAAAVAPKPPPRKRRGWRIAGWTIAALFALLAAVLGAAWWWAGSDSSLATALHRAARYLPAGQTLESRDVTGSLRGGGRIGWLRWSSPGMAVEVEDARIGWRLAPLVLDRRVQLGEVHAARVLITPQPTDKPAEPLQPLQSLPLPVQVDLPFRIDQLVWAPPASEPLAIAQLSGRYDYDGSRHQLVLENIDIAQGSYFGRATLGAQAPMPLDVQLDGKVRTATPGGGAELQATAHATVKGTLATEAARLQVAAQLRSSLDDAEAAQSAVAAASTASAAPAKERTARKKGAAPAPSAPPPPAEPMQADLQAQIAPWAPQPLVQASAALRALDLAALWPKAPLTRLSGELRAEPTATGPAATPGTSGTAPAATGWNISAQLKNALPGPWDRQRLPAGAVEARAAYDGTQWTVPQATVTIGEDQGRIEAQGSYTPATRALQGRLQLRELRPDAIYSTLDRAPLSGTASARGEDDGLVRFTADVRSAASSAARGGKPGSAAPLRIDRLAAEGSWREGRVDLARLQLDALQAQVSARQVQIDTAGLAGRGQLQATAPGISLQMDGQMAPRSGTGTLDVRVADAQRLQRWIDTLPGGAGALQGAVLDGSATLAARWNGGWQTLQRQLHAAGLLRGTAPEGGSGGFTLQARLDAPRLKADLPPRPGSNAGPQTLQLTDAQGTLSGSLQQLTLAWDGQLRQGEQRAALRLRASGGQAGAPGNWRAQIGELRVVASMDKQPGPWTLQLAQPLAVTVRQHPTLLVETSAGAASITGPRPGEARLDWQPVRFAQTAQGGMQLRTQGTLQGLPTAWADAFAGNDGPWLQRLGLASSLVLGGDWNIDLGDTLRASATVRRASGDLRILTGDTGSVPATIVVRSSGQGTGAGVAQMGDGAGTLAGIRQAEVRIDAEGDTVRARVLWDSERAGQLQAEGSTRLARGKDGGWLWPADAPLAATVKAQLPDVGVWSALAPPGWRVKGTLQADAALSGTRTAPRWSGTLGADQMAVRSLLDGVDLQDGRLRAVLRGDRLEITEFRVNGGQGSNARIPGFSGNLTPPPKSGGTLTGTGFVSWADALNGKGGAGSGIAMDFSAEARALQVLVRADRQVSISGNVQARLQNGQLSLRGKLTTDRATIILPEAGAPTLGSDVVVRSAAKDREALAQAQKTAQAEARIEAARPPDIALTLNLGDDFALQGFGITTRLAGELEIRSAATAGAPPRVTGEIRTVQGRYRAWGQSLDVENGLIRFNGPYDNPALDVLAIRPNISVRAGVQVTGTAKAPRVRLYSDPDLPDAEKLSWVVLGRSAAAGGAEAALLQQAALALLSGNGDGGSGNFARRLGLDEIGFRGPGGSGDDASGAALTFGKRLSKDLYVTYERSLSGALGTLYIFYDLSRRLTLRAQTGAQSAVDLIYTLRYN